MGDNVAGNDVAGNWEAALAQVEQRAATGLWDEVCDELAWLIQEWEDQGKPAAIAQELAHLMGLVVTLGDRASQRAVSRLWRRLGLQGVSTLRDILTDPEEDFHGRWLAGRSLGELGAAGMTEARDVVLALLGDQQDEETLAIVSGALTHMGAPAIASLGALLDQPDTRPAAVRSLAKICHPDIVTPLLTVMDDPTPQIRAIALEAIGNFQDRRSLPLLLQALDDPASAVRREAVRGLGQKAKAITKSPVEINGKPLGQPQLESILVTCLRDFSIEVCQQGAIALGRLATPTAVDALNKTLQRETTPVPLRKTIVQTLGWSDRPEALDALATYLNQSIKKPDQLPASPEKNQSEIPLNIHPDAQETVQAIIQMLGRVNGTQSRSKARHILHTWWHQATQTQPKVNPGEQRSPSPALAVPIREAIAQSLGQLGDPNSREILDTLVQDPVPSVRYRAEAALRALS